MRTFSLRIRALLTAAAICVCALLPSHANAQAQVVRVALSLTTYSNLPLFLAADKGYFRDAGLDVQRSGWSNTSWLSVRQDLWDSNAIRQPKDLRGKIIDGAAEG